MYVQKETSRLLCGNSLLGVSAVLGDKLQFAATQVCLAAEKCGNLDFDVRNDMWNSSEGLFCTTSVHRTITFWDILTKVSRLQHNQSCIEATHNVHKIVQPMCCHKANRWPECIGCSLQTLRLVSMTSHAACTHYNNHQN